MIYVTVYIAIANSLHQIKTILRKDIFNSLILSVMMTFTEQTYQKMLQIHL